MEAVDLDHNGQVNFTEFLVAGMNEEKALTLKKVEDTFKMIDLDGNNYLSRDEIELLMGEITDEVWNDFLADCDFDNDGKVISLITDFIG